MNAKTTRIRLNPGGGLVIKSHPESGASFMTSKLQHVRMKWASGRVKRCRIPRTSRLWKCAFGDPYWSRTGKSALLCAAMALIRHSARMHQRAASGGQGAHHELESPVASAPER